MASFREIEENLQIHMKSHKTPNNPRNPEQKEQFQMDKNIKFQTMLQFQCNKTVVYWHVLQKQKHTPIDENIRLRNKLMYL